MKKSANAVETANRHPQRCNGGESVRTAVRASAELRVLPAQAPEQAAKEGVVLPRAPRSSSCPRFVRRRLAHRLPELCEALIDSAVAGDLQAAKLLWQMAELDKPAARSSETKKTDSGFARKALAEFRAR